MQYAINPNKKTCIFYTEFNRSYFEMNLNEAQYERLLEFHYWVK